MSVKIPYRVLGKLAYTIVDAHNDMLNHCGKFAGKLASWGMANDTCRFVRARRTFYLLYLIFYNEQVLRARRESIDQAYTLGYKAEESGIAFQDILAVANHYRRAFMGGIRKLFRQHELSAYEKAESVIDEFIDQFQLGYLTKKENTIERLHEQKMVIMGQMAAGMAHEVRNPLSAIEGFLTLIGEDKEGVKKKHQEYIRIVLQETKQINRIVTQFLQFSRKGHAEAHAPADESICSLLLEVKEFVEPRTINDNIFFTMELPEEDFTVRVHKEEIKQVLLNIIHNAFEAVHNKEERRVQVKVNGQLSGQGAEITILDNGCGIPAYVLDKVFEPFYSTKVSGTGIGLALSRELIRKNEGEIQVQSGESGTAFTIYIPASLSNNKKKEEI
ncbi:two-component system sensor histidine kinase NtrB [Aneurinibacillus tyrosinisolvens]|uniref:two-component system sensor histidine kinase NtrB n=1 Tax=Aneurinibacillus tyrosinisolvens TaxID=1443435 RepID=UPI0006995A50|nr:ATP-binding protein [Aneurinibacillus tyrosinisolvens]